MAFWMVPVLALAGCRYHKPAYESVLNYPVKEAPTEEVLYSPDHTMFSVWSPNADSVMLYLYDAGEGGEPLRSTFLKPHKDGSWTTRQKGDLAGLFYTFQIKENGRWYHETPGIFAKAVGINGQRGAIVDLGKTNPEGWADDRRPELQDLNDAVIYGLPCLATPWSSGSMSWRLLIFFSWMRISASSSTHSMVSMLVAK
jgi:pullulanase